MANYDTSKLVKLEGLKALAERVNSDFVKNDDFDEVSGKVDSIETNVTQLHGQVSELEEVADTYAIKTEVETTYATKSEVEETYLTQTDAADTYATQESIKTQISSVYKPGGSKDSVESLGTPSESNLGYVYNMTKEFTITNNFVEYDADKEKKYSAGTNVVVIDVGDGKPEYKFDVLAGFVDLTDYATTENVRTIVDNKLDDYYDSDTIDDMIATDNDVDEMLNDVLGSTD